MGLTEDLATRLWLATCTPKTEDRPVDWDRRPVVSSIDPITHPQR